MKTKLFLENNRVLDYINKYNMFKAGNRVVVGLSGGPDSVCLLFVLWELREKLGISIKALHVHHGIRGAEADRDEAFCEKICSDKGIPFESIHVDAPAKAKSEGLSLEEAARILRYEALNNVPADKIAIAHNADDNAETVIFNMCRGCGIDGLKGIVPVRDNIVRPLLEIRKNAIVEFLDDAGIPYIYDSTNSNKEYSRNGIRADVIPGLQDVNEAAVNHILHMTEKIQIVADYFDHMVEKFLDDNLSPMGLDINSILSQEPLMQNMIIKKYLSIYMPDEKDVSEKHIEQTLSICNDGPERYVDLPHKKRVTSAGGKLFFDGIKMPEYDVVIKDFERPKGVLIPTNSYTKWLDYDKIKGDVVIRTRQSSDYLVINSSGGRKSLKDYFIDQKIPKYIRDEIKLVCEGNHVLWVVGYRISEDVKVTDETSHILELSTDLNLSKLMNKLNKPVRRENE